MICGDDRMNTKVDWIEIERRVRAGESARAISRDLTAGGHKISHTAINKHCKRGGWKLHTSTATIANRPHGDHSDVGIPTSTAEEAGQMLNVNRSTVFEAKAVLRGGTPEEIEAGKTGKAAANHAPVQDLDSDTTDGAPQELPTERTPVETPQKKAKPRRRTLWALQRNGTARVVGFYDKGV